MDLFSLTHLVAGNDDPYIALSNKLVGERYAALMKGLDLPADESVTNAQCYTLVDFNALCEKHYGADFAKWKKANVSDIQFLDDLAQKVGVVFMYGPSFEAPEGSVRVSLANNDAEDYNEIARRVFEVLDEYYTVGFGSKALPEAA